MTRSKRKLLWIDRMRYCGILCRKPPIFKNTEIHYKDLSAETKAEVNPNYKSKKLVVSMFGKKMLFPTELLKWYLEPGLVISNITCVVRYERKAPFKSFSEQPLTSLMVT
jgi:hypothetical protein